MKRDYALGGGLATAALLAITPADAQDHARPDVAAQSSASASVVTRIAIATGPDFSLGGVLLQTGSAAGTIVVDPSGTRAVTGNIAAPSSSAEQAYFEITGDADQAISIALPKAVQLVRIDGAESVTIAMLTDLPDTAGLQTLAGRHAGSGRLVVNVGGRLDIDSHAVAGVYRGTLLATAQYN